MHVFVGHNLAGFHATGQETLSFLIFKLIKNELEIDGFPLQKPIKIDIIGKIHFAIDSCSLVSQSNTLDHLNQ